MDRKHKGRKKRRWWVHDILRKRKEYGVFNHLFKELKSDDDKFVQYLRVTREQFARLLFFTGKTLTKRSRFREVISPEERLAICLRYFPFPRYLATGESFHSLAFSFRVGVSTVSNIVAEVCSVIWSKMSHIYMKVPTTSEEWLQKAAGFEHVWNFPHCVGAIDGKHVNIKAPENSGSLYFNYKNTFSIVLLALVDANMQFTAIDVGAYGRNSDGGIFANSNMGKVITNGLLNWPLDEPMPSAAHMGPMPYVVLGEEAFPLQRHLMRPFPGRGCPKQEQIFNYRLSRARRIVENAFGLLAARWRLYHAKIAVNTTVATNVVKATCLLHNMIQSESTPSQTAAIMVDPNHNSQSLVDFSGTGNRAAKQAKDIRERFKEYFCHIAPLPWQENVTDRGK
ncbi:Protein ALP1-like [Holothuria leucospilota]|uniref:Protein ALP1-like n=1 Tax=Holothuria leucospilota TaxID=206669 RepID=A0A9Q1BEN1_HOLLE|nr:Protein ALP1-like [Holothuria leucospilota]